MLMIELGSFDAPKDYGLKVGVLAKAIRSQLEVEIYELSQTLPASRHEETVVTIKLLLDMFPNIEKLTKEEAMRMSLRKEGDPQ